MDRKESGHQALENLEDLLIYDDMFLDYFNAFLSLPAFPQVLQYHRLTGTFRIVDSPDDSLVEWNNSSEPLYGATDDERETIMAWAQGERLPLFTKTELYREYKLCKLLLRPVDARRIGARPGTYVRGYSRTSGSMVSLTDTEAAGSSDEDEEDEDEEDDEEFDDSQEEEGEEDENNATGNDVSDLTSSSGMSNRPPTHARSLPDRLAGKSGSSGARRRRRRPRDTEFGDSTVAADFSGSGVAIDASATTPSRIHRRWKPPTSDGRTYSAPHNYQEFAMLPMSSDFDLQEAPAVVSFSTRAGAGGPGDSVDLKGLEARQNLPFDRLKELMLANRQGVQEFFEFLRPTAGLQLVDFWLDCEFYKDTALDRSDADNRQTRGRLLRDLQDKYRLRLTEEAKAQMRNAANDPQQANSILLRTQYDVLRRLRSYWLPRYIIHKERELSGHTFSDLQQAWLSNATRRTSAVSTIFPSLSLVNSMPVRPDVAHNLAITESWDRVRAGGRRLDDRVRSARGQPLPTAVASKPVSASRPFQARLRDALTVDRIAGGPFRSFLELRHRDPELLACLMFFQEVEEYSRRDERTSDRFLRLGHAWNIFNRYLNVNATQPVKVDKRESQAVLEVLRRSKDIVPSKVFAKAQDSVVSRMGDTWLRFLKEDVKNFLESSVSHRDSDSPPRTSDEIQVYIENGKIIVKRLQPERSQAQLQLQRRRSWDFLTDEEKAERRRAAAERRRVTELERKKALKAARKRLREMEEAGRKKNTLKPLDEELGSKQWTTSTATDDYLFRKESSLQQEQSSHQPEDPFADSYNQAQFVDFEDAMTTAAAAAAAASSSRKSVQFDLPKLVRSREPTDLEGVDVNSPTGRIFAEMVQHQRVSRALLRFDFAKVSDEEDREMEDDDEEEEEEESEDDSDESGGVDERRELTEVVVSKVDSNYNHNMPNPPVEGASNTVIGRDRTDSPELPPLDRRFARTRSGRILPRVEQRVRFPSNNLAATAHMELPLATPVSSMSPSRLVLPQLVSTQSSQVSVDAPEDTLANPQLPKMPHRHSKRHSKRLKQHHPQLPVILSPSTDEATEQRGFVSRSVTKDSGFHDSNMQNQDDDASPSSEVSDYSEARTSTKRRRKRRAQRRGPHESTDAAASAFIDLQESPKDADSVSTCAVKPIEK